MKSNCNNCGKPGHQFGQCRQPNISCGIILCTLAPAATTAALPARQWKYLMVCRKNSFGYTDYIHTRFASSNVKHVRRLVDEMTVGEKTNLRTKPFDWLWKNMWLGEGAGDSGSNSNSSSGSSGSSSSSSGSSSSSSSSSNRSAAEDDAAPSSHKKRFESVHPSILRDALDASATQWVTPEWEFPKGHRNFNERDVLCALREFEEETGISREAISIVDNVSPFEEIFIGSDHKSYKYRYFLAVTGTEIASTTFQKSEISGMSWKTAEECIQLIRPYNTEKKRLVSMIDTILTTYLIR